MSDPAAVAPADGSLQFDRAERTAAPAEATCAVCRQPVGATYYEVNGNVTCPRCRGQILATWNRGSPGKRFAKAFALGGAAAVLGAGGYFAFVALSGMDWSLVTVLIGLFVGVTVRKGSNGRGGWRYQALAMFLTYCAIAATDSSLIAREMAKDLRPTVDSSATAATTTSGSAVAKERERPGPIALAMGLTLLLGLAFAAPILTGIAAPLHLVIAGFGVYAAWKINRGAALRVTGPYQAAARPATA